MSQKIYNFTPGPAKLPSEVLAKAQAEFIEYEHTGISIIEMSHRSKEWEDVMHRCEKNLRNVMNIPDTYNVLFLQGGGSGQFSAVPLNLCYLSKGDQPSADYVITGEWSKKAAKEAEKYLKVQRAIEPALDKYTCEIN